MSQSHFIKNGSTIQVADAADLTVLPHLPPATYVVVHTPDKGFFLKEIDRVQVSGKVYGSSEQDCERYFKTFGLESGNLGVLLIGEKGSGKTLLAKMISIKGYEKGMPTIVINEAHCGDAFNKFIQSIDQECIVLLDEFEKTYDEEDQERMLTLLDGTFKSHKLFVITANKAHRLDDNLNNRPGRVRYTKVFKGLTEEMISEYVLDQGGSAEILDGITKVSRAFAKFNFDMLSTLLEECTRYGESPKASVKMLGFKPEADHRNSFEIRVIHKGVTLARDAQVPSKGTHSPLNFRKIHLSFDTTSPDISQERLMRESTIEHDEYPPRWQGDNTNRKSIDIDMKSASLKFSERGIEYVADEDTTVVFVKDLGFEFNWDAF